MQHKTFYRVTFVNQEKVYEIYARHVGQCEIFGFVAIEGFAFDETSSLVVDPGQEKLKSEFQGVKSTYVPMHSIIRIDVVEKEGVAKIMNLEGNIRNFPTPIYTKPSDLN